MEKIKIQYPHLKHYQVDDIFEQPIIPDELIFLLKELIPFYTSIGLCHKRGSIELEESDSLSHRNKCIREKIFSFDYLGEIVFNLNNTPVIVKIYYDEELERKAIDIEPTSIVTFNFEFE